MPEVLDTTRKSLSARHASGPRETDDPLSGFFPDYHGSTSRGLRLLLDATNKCNLRCVMCHFAFESVQRIRVIQWSTEQLESLEREVLPVTGHAILSAGTEPLMWKGFPQLLDALERARVPTVEMITNGTLMTAQLARRIASVGMAKVQLSVDGATQETYEHIRVGAKFTQFLRALDLLNEAKAEVGSCLPALQFNFIMMRRNIEELEELVRFAYRSGVAYLDLRHVVQIDGLDMERETLCRDKQLANRHLDRARALADELGVELASCPPNFALDGDDAAAPTHAPEAPAVEAAPAEPPEASKEEPPASTDEPQDPVPESVWRRPPGYADGDDYVLTPAQRLDPENLPESPLCDAPWKQFNVRPDGTVVPCCYWYSEEPLGDTNEQSFDEIWEGAAYRKLRHEMLTGNLGDNCRHCPVVGIGELDREEAHKALTTERSKARLSVRADR